LGKRLRKERRSWEEKGRTWWIFGWEFRRGRHPNERESAQLFWGGEEGLWNQTVIGGREKMKALGEGLREGGGDTRFNWVGREDFVC